jgi:uncharacterized protein YaaW (UPF0174 family)
MAYRSDKEIEFIGELKSEDLNDLVYCLTKDKDGTARLTEELTTNPKYKQHYPNHNMYWTAIAGEIQCFGANSLATLLRGGEGVPYREVLTDVCDRLKVNYNKEATIESIEDNLLMKIVTDAIDKMTDAERKELAESIGFTNISASKEFLLGAFQAVFRAGGFKSYQLTVIIVNAVLKALIGRGLSFAATGTMMRAISVMTGPIGWAITGAWAVLDIASPAYRVTVPTVIQIAFLRKKHLYGELSQQVNFS